MRSRRVVVIVAVVALTLGTAQTALADNNATGSVGAVQTGPVGATPTVGASQAGATAAASVPVSIGGSGNNTATNSTGAVQAGGGNTSNNSTGTAQVSSVHASPSASAGASGNNASASVPVTVGGNGGNNASGSTGAAQIGGGNSSAGSTGVFQSGGVTAGPAVGAGGTTTSAPLTLGGEGTNTATDSIGAAQLGGGNNAAGSMGTAQSGPFATFLSVDSAALESDSASGTAADSPSSTAIAVGLPQPGSREAEGAPNRTRNTFGAVKSPTGEPRTLAQLPFTGLGLLLVALVGLAMLATGLTTRARTRLGSV
jgi:hypothetical protein